MHQRAKYAQKVKGLRAKLFNKKRFQEKAEMKRIRKRMVAEAEAAKKAKCGCLPF